MAERLIINQMNENDVPMVADIEKQCFSLPWSEKGFMESLAQNYAYFVVARCGKEIAGYGGIYILSGEGEITNIAVKENYRGNGIGKSIVEALLAESIKRGAERTILEVRESNTPAISLYEKCGFEQFSVRKNFYEKPVENAVIMWKNHQ